MVRDNELYFGDFEFQNLSKALVNLYLKFITTILRNFWSKITGQPQFWQKKSKNNFFQIFLHKIILFLYEIEFYMKNAFLWFIICWYRSKIAKFWNFTHLLAIFDKIFNFRIFFCALWKKIPKKAQINCKWSKLMWKQDFWPFGGSRAEKLPWVYVGQIDPPSPGIGLK